MRLAQGRAFRFYRRLRAGSRSQVIQMRINLRSVHRRGLAGIPRLLRHRVELRLVRGVALERPVRRASAMRITALPMAKLADAPDLGLRNLRFQNLAKICQLPVNSRRTAS